MFIKTVDRRKIYRLYVHTMDSPRLAESYCDRMYEAELTQRGQQHQGLWGSYGDSTSYDMYLALIKVGSDSMLYETGTIIYVSMETS